jgi:hypothetical protein
MAQFAFEFVPVLLTTRERGPEVTERQPHANGQVDAAFGSVGVLCGYVRRGRAGECV